MNENEIPGLARRALGSALIVTIKGFFPGPDGQGFDGANSFHTTLIADEPVHSIADVHRLVGAMAVLLGQHGWSALVDGEVLAATHAGGGLLVDTQTGEATPIAPPGAETDWWER